MVGMSAAQANRLLLNSGFNICVQGAKDYLKSNKTVIAQSVAAGERLARGSVIVLRFAYDETRD